MIKKIVVYTGSKKDFHKFIDKSINQGEKKLAFMELIQQYNARLRPSESGIRESTLRQRISVENCIVEADDYGSVLDHVLANFVNIVCTNHDIDTLYMHNPPKRVLGSLEAYASSKEGCLMEYKTTSYRSITKVNLKKIYENLNSEILGQDDCKKQLISGLYKNIKSNTNKPSVLLLYGPSGVGKTQSAKNISKTLGGDLLRIQFSMMQTNEAYNYVYGAEHSHSSFARDLQGRETNIVLIDEFDKVNPGFYNAFYELFDDGMYVDTNYIVDCRKTTFILTSNFSSEKEIKKVLGAAMFSRIGSFVKYEEIGKDEKLEIIRKWYSKILEHLDTEDQDYINHQNILEWFEENVGRYNNIRLMKSRMENAIYDSLAERLIHSVNKGKYVQWR